jgi:hypothetical protein
MALLPSRRQQHSMCRFLVLTGEAFQHPTPSSPLTVDGVQTALPPQQLGARRRVVTQILQLHVAQRIPLESGLGSALCDDGALSREQCIEGVSHRKDDLSEFPTQTTEAVPLQRSVAVSEGLGPAR